MTITILQDELWYGGLTMLGTRMPFDADTELDLKLSVNTTANQGMPYLLSNKGRWIWLNTPYDTQIGKGRITVPEGSAFGKSGESLRDAYLYLNSTYFPQSDRMPDKRLFSEPIFNTWIEYTYSQSEKNTLEYARSIIKAGFEPGVLMIDDSWSHGYGDWRFDREKFPHPDKMLEKLHDMGFAVMLWICPYISPDTPEYRDALGKNLLLEDKEGGPFIVKWWNGYSAALNLGNRESLRWLRHQMDKLTAMGVDGFKFDGADPFHYIGACQNGAGIDPNDMARCWGDFASNWPLNELRASWEAAGMPEMQRLSDKDHSWGENGIASLVPDTLALGLMGSPYSSPDMIGGGEYTNFEKNSNKLDTEIFLRHAAAAALMPAIQFSAAPWRILSRKDQNRLERILDIRRHYQKTIMKLLKESRTSNEPVVRHMEYVFPQQGYGYIRDQFMLGDDILVAPVLERNSTGRAVAVPEGTWLFRGREMEGGRKVTLDGEDVPLLVLERRPH